jgi:hypothetical protein
MGEHMSQITPLLIGPANAVAATGANWRWVRSTAAELGVPIVGHGRKQFVNAAAFMAALERGVPTAEPVADAVPVDAAEAIRRALGKRRRAA